MNKKDKNTTIIIIIVAIFAVVAFITGLLLNFVVVPRIKEAKVNSFIEQKNYVEAVEILQTLKGDDNKKLLDKTVIDACEKYMDEGNYIAAATYINGYKDNSEYDKICKEIKYETYTLYCCNQLNVAKEDEIKSAKFYKTQDNKSYDFYFGLISIDVENAFGNKDTNYSCFDAKKLDYLGTTKTFDTDKIDNKSEMYAALGWAAYYDKSAISGEINLKRINNIIKNDIKYNIDIESWKNK